MFDHWLMVDHYRKVRFVVLSTDRLQYFEDPSKQVKKGDLLITDETEVEGRVGSNHEFKFTIKTGSKSLTMAAASSEMREEWTQAVRKLVGLKLSAASIKEISAIAPSSSTSKQAGMQQTLRRRKVPFAGETEGRGAPGSPQPSMDAEMNGRTRSVSQPTAAHREAADEGQTLHRPASVAVSRQAPATAEAEGMVGEDNGWEKVDSPEGTYYYHKKTRVSRWDKPDDAVTAALNSRLQDTERSADSAFQVC